MTHYKIISLFSCAVILLGSATHVYSQPVEDLPEINNQPEKKIEFTENPCPNPREALSETPNDLQIIQEDITRFNLCLQRAQLLSRLNILAEENSETINSSLNKKLETVAGGFQPAQMPALTIPQVTAPQMPSPELFNDTNTESLQQQDDTVAPVVPVTPPVIEEPKEYGNWSISTIEGTGGALVATLIDVDGNIARVKTGNIIPDTEIKVSKVSQTNVHITENEETAKLKWKQ